jgi:hypothetical protein
VAEGAPTLEDASPGLYLHALVWLVRQARESHRDERGDQREADAEEEGAS